MPNIQYLGKIYGVAQPFWFFVFGVISLVFMTALQIIIKFYLYYNSLDLIKGNIIAATIIKLRCADA